MDRWCSCFQPVWAKENNHNYHRCALFSCVTCTPTLWLKTEEWVDRSGVLVFLSSWCDIYGGAEWKDAHAQREDSREGTISLQFQGLNSHVLTNSTPNSCWRSNVICLSSGWTVWRTSWNVGLLWWPFYCCVWWLEGAAQTPVALIWSLLLTAVKQT